MSEVTVPQIEIPLSPNREPSPVSTNEKKPSFELPQSDTAHEILKKLATEKSITGNDLSNDWPKNISEEEERSAYQVLYDPEDNRNQPPSHAHIERLSYQLENGDKRLRYFAAFHQRDMQGPDDPNMIQYALLEQRFTESPPQLVLYEGFIDDVNYPLSRDQAISLGEPAFMAYLVQQHNAKLKEGESPVIIESADHHVNMLPNQERDKAIVKNISEKNKQYDRIDIVMGSGHAIREKEALEQFYEAKAA